jgi:hypothetical protein
MALSEHPKRVGSKRIEVLRRNARVRNEAKRNGRPVDDEDRRREPKNEWHA